ncbi:Alpha-L-fucosidase 2 precursor, putative [Ricinus communis]|uniref:Alpha-L-fucosidase 2, putative n=2 Tax=Ricinus communis TaxID=3988 RepID=B9SFN9_RICCO|nr:Alpha-L-fucosidase 2 precursor, putative [Ricinus communis]
MDAILEGPSSCCTEHHETEKPGHGSRQSKCIHVSLTAAMVLEVYALRMLTLIFTFMPAVSPSNFSYPAVFNFGDSNSDTGGLVAGVAFPVGPPNGQTHFQEPAGRFCDGRLIIDFLMDAMDHSFLSPYLDSVGAPNFHMGCNFATGGSSILPANKSSRFPFSFGTQVSQFIHFKARVLELIAKDRKLRKYLPLEQHFKDGLYTFDVGQNDLDGAFSSKPEDQVLAFIPNILSEFETGVEGLYSQGARNFWIHNTGPLGCLPRIIATFGKNASKLDQFGCVNSHNHAATVFNTQLQSLCTKLRAQYSDATVTCVDIFSIKLNLISNFSQYGFEQSLAACCGYGGPPLNFDSRIACGETKTLNGSTVTASPCNNTAKYVNWDGNHYTEAANKYVSEQILAGNYSDPPLSVIRQVNVESKFINYKMLY